MMEYRQQFFGDIPDLDEVSQTHALAGHSPIILPLLKFPPLPLSRSSGP